MSNSPSGVIHGESSSRVSKLKQEYDRRLLHYEKEFDVSVSRTIHRDKGIKDSMLAYTERMRKLSNTKNSSEHVLSPEPVPLYVRAKHIPKFPLIKSTQRRPASFDELVGKSYKNSRPRREKPKSASRLSLPTLPDRYNKSTHHVKISFVSASDLYDIVDFSIRNKSNKEETLKFLEMESMVQNKSPSPINRPLAAVNRKPTKISDKNDQNDKPVTGQLNGLATLPPIETKESDKDPDSDLSDTENDSIDVQKATSFRRRPNRAKRMQINKPDLDAIPENDVASQNRSAKSERTLPSPPPKQSPRNIMTLQSQLVSIPEVETNTELLQYEKKKLGKIQRQGGPSVTAMVRLEPFAQNDRNIYKYPDEANTDRQMNMKLKAQKRFKKLIFLRDIPDRNHRL